MKTCKKIAIMAIMMVIAILSSTINVYAGLAEIILKSVPAEASVGDTVKVTFNGKCGLGVEGVEATLVYDKTKLSLVTEEGKAAINGYLDMSGTNGAGEYKLTIMYAGAGDTPTEVDFANLEFKVLDGANVNDNLSVKLTDVQFVDTTGLDGSLADSEVIIKVVEKQQPPVDEDCVHDYKMKSDATHHWEECTKCKEEKTGTKEVHTFDKYVDNGEGKHSRTCKVCNYTEVSSHNMEDGKCKDCGAIDSNDNKEDCTHTYEMTKDTTHHWEECTKCKEEKSGTKELHKYGEYKDNGERTHVRTCSVCNHKDYALHNMEDGKCKDCGVKDSSNTNNNNNNNNNNDSTGGNKDNTTTGNEIPKAGLDPMFAAVIVATAVVTLVMYVKNKKYKDII